MEIFKILGEVIVNTNGAQQAIKEVSTEAGKASDSVNDFEKKNADAMPKVESFWGKVQNIAKNTGKAMVDAGKAIAPISTAAGAVFTGAVLGASNFNDSMAKMSTLFDTNKYSVSDLSTEFLQLSNDTGKSATELAEAGYQALSAGRSVEEVGGFVKTSGELAKAGFTSTTTAVDILTTVMNAYGDKAGTAEDISSKLVRTQNLGKTTVDELASSMGKIIPTANMYNVGIDALCSGYALLTKNGISTAESTTYFNSMLNELGKKGTTASDALKKATEHIKKGGLSFSECMEQGMGLEDVLSLLSEQADETGLSMGDMFGSAEAAKAAAILNSKGEEYVEILETMETQGNDVAEALEKLETPSEKLQKSMNRAKNAGIEMGTAFIESAAPAIEKVVSAGEKASAWFSNLDGKTKTMITTALLFIAGLSPVLIIGGKIIQELWVDKQKGALVNKTEKC